MRVYKKPMQEGWRYIYIENDSQQIYQKLSNSHFLMKNKEVRIMYAQCRWEYAVQMRSLTNKNLVNIGDITHLCCMASSHWSCILPFDLSSSIFGTFTKTSIWSAANTLPKEVMQYG